MADSTQIIADFLQAKYGIAASQAETDAAELERAFAENDLDYVRLRTDGDGCIVGYNRAYNAWIEKREKEDAEILQQMDACLRGS